MLKNSLHLAVLAVFSSYTMSVFADDASVLPPVPETVLDTIVIQGSATKMNTSLLDSKQKGSDLLIKKDTLKTRATTLGDALDGELGIHSNQFGGGASSPIIRGQEGKRITILQNNADVIDMAHLSPDHAVMVDTTLAKQIEMVRGVSTLLYKSGNSAGAVNVIDNKIPSQLPKKPIESEVGIRYNTGNDEKLETGSLTAQLGKHMVFHAEGLHKDANNYQTPNYGYMDFDTGDELDNYVKAPELLQALEKEWQAIQKGVRLPFSERTYFITDEAGYLKQKASLDKDLAAAKTYNFDYLPESWAKSKAGSVGLSWVGDKGYIGVAVSERKDKYGLPAHNHLYEGCSVISIFDSFRYRPYLQKYPQLIDESDVNYINPRPDCEHAHGNSESHGIQDKHDHAPPFIDLVTKRYDLRGEWQNPTSWISKVRGNVGYVDYQHDEKEGNIVSTSFKNKGKVARLELTHEPTERLKMLWGLQYLQQDNSAESPVTQWRNQQVLTKNDLTNQSIFAMGKYDFDKLSVELGTRLEKQKVAMDFDKDYIENRMRQSSWLKGEKLEHAITYALDATKPNEKTAHSYALGLNYQFLPDYTLSLNVSHQERLPNSQELYTHGMHLATNSFEIGNRHLQKEKSNNYELTLAYQGDKLDYKVSGYLYDFDNYIYLQSINEYLGTARIQHVRQLRINRYDQSPAKFYGAEVSIGYQFSPIYYASIFGDYVKGRLHDMPDIVVDYKPAGWFDPEVKTYGKQEDRYTPRLPPMRLGAKVQADFDEKWSGSLEFVHTFDQERVSKFEGITKGNNLLNMGIDYKNFLGNADYSIFFKANNLLDEKVYAHETFLPYIPQMGRNFSLGINVKF